MPKSPKMALPNEKIPRPKTDAGTKAPVVDKTRAKRKPPKPNLVNPSSSIGNNLVNKGGSTENANSIPAGRLGDAVHILAINKVSVITCNTCKKKKNLEEYSNKQLRKAADSYHNPYAISTNIKPIKSICKMCTVGCVAHLSCIICGNRKELEKFAKAQRRNPDKARCLRCVQMNLDIECEGEVMDSDYLESDGDDDEDDGDVDNPLGECAPDGIKTPVSKPQAHIGGIEELVTVFDEMALIPTGFGGTTPTTEYNANDDDDAWTCVSNPIREREGTVSRQSGISGRESVATKRGGWGPRPRNPNTNPSSAVLQPVNVWETATSRRNGWTAFGGAPRMFKSKNTLKKDTSHEGDSGEED